MKLTKKDRKYLERLLKRHEDSLLCNYDNDKNMMCMLDLKYFRLHFDNIKDIKALLKKKKEWFVWVEWRIF